VPISCKGMTTVAHRSSKDMASSGGKRKVRVSRPLSVTKSNESIFQGANDRGLSYGRLGRSRAHSPDARGAYSPTTHPIGRARSYLASHLAAGHPTCETSGHSTYQTAGRSTLRDLLAFHHTD
jgi:hypothetical protein